MRQRTLFLLLFWLCLALSCVQAGVVGDAEEELKRVKESRGEVVRRTKPDFESSGFPTASFDSQESTEFSDRGPGQRGKESSTKSTSAGSAMVPALSEDEPAGQVNKRVRKRDRSDRNFSLMGIILFLALIIGGAVYGSRSQPES